MWCTGDGRVRPLPRATAALLVVGQLRDTRLAPRINGAFAGVSKHVYANVELLNSKTNATLSQHALYVWLNATQPVWTLLKNYSVPPQLNCTVPVRADPSANAPQFQRLYDTFLAARAHERCGNFSYRWFARLRTDLLHTPPLGFSLAQLDGGCVHLYGTWHYYGLNRNASHWIPRDYFFLAPSELAPRLFQFASAFRTCQDVGANHRICEGPLSWAAIPECLLKAHLVRNDLPFRVH